MTIGVHKSYSGLSRVVLAAAIGSLVLSTVSQPAFAQHNNGVGIPVFGMRPPDKPPVAGQPLETRRAAGEGQKPAFPGQTRAVAVITQTPYEEKIVTQGLNQPWGMTFLPNDQILISERPGTMRVVNMKTGKIIRGVQGLPPVFYNGDGGLLDVVADPKYASNHLIYFTYVEPRGTPYPSTGHQQWESAMQQDNGVVVVKATLNPGFFFLSNITPIYRVTPSISNTAHYGSRLLFDKDGNLFVTLGERFFYPTRGDAQSLFSDMGKIIHITTDGKPAPGNPFNKDQSLQDHPLAEIWSYGHRNPQGLAFNPVTGDLWESEHGPQGGDEINLIQPGKNYGWPVIAYGTNYDGTKFDGTETLEDRMGQLPPAVQPELNAGSLTAMKGMEQPMYYWDPAVAPSGITFYDGKLIPEWKNNLFVAALAGQHISRLVLDGNHVIGEERLLLDQHQRIRDVQEGPDGALWAITDDAEGRLIRIAPR